MAKKKAKAKKTTKTRTKKLAEATVSGNIYTARLGNGQTISAFSLKTANYLTAAYTRVGGAGDVALTLEEAKAIGEALKQAIPGATVEIFKVKQEGATSVKTSETEAVKDEVAKEAPKKKGFFKRLIGA